MRMTVCLCTLCSRTEQNNYALRLPGCKPLLRCQEQPTKKICSIKKWKAQRNCCTAEGHLLLIASKFVK